MWREYKLGSVQVPSLLNFLSCLLLCRVCARIHPECLAVESSRFDDDTLRPLLDSKVEIQASKHG